MTNRTTARKHRRHTPNVDIPSNAVAILQILEPEERRVMSLRWGVENGRPLHQTEIGKIMGVSHSTISRIEKGVRERIADLTPSQLSTLVEAQESQVTVDVDAIIKRIDTLVSEVQKMEARLMREITRVEGKVRPVDPPAAPKRIGLFRRGR
jgi:transcriptional regulator with XRE-family HTH domain